MINSKDRSLNLIKDCNHPHYHKNENGAWVKCYHACKSVLLGPGFWIGTTLSFPIEHYLWEKVWPFTLITAWLGL